MQKSIDIIFSIPRIEPPVRNKKLVAVVAVADAVVAADAVAIAVVVVVAAVLAMPSGAVDEFPPTRSFPNADGVSCTIPRHSPHLPRGNEPCHTAECHDSSGHDTNLSIGVARTRIDHCHTDATA